jgi:aspartate kinase
MRIFKFGGASVRDAEGIRNVCEVLRHTGFDNVLIIVSAMGKTTNTLEFVVYNYFNKPSLLQESLQNVRDYHEEVLAELYDNKQSEIFGEVQRIFEDIQHFLSHNKSPNYNFVYDQIVSYGEIISSTILSHYLVSVGIENQWIDVRDYIKTDSGYRDACVDWVVTKSNLTSKINRNVLNVTQGFLGSDQNGFSTTLGREGSDYTAAIIAYSLNVESVTIWKDVHGVMSADPRYFPDAVLLNKISYREAIELAFYGASIIHPKTLQPLQKNGIPLFVKSFIDPSLPGTIVGKCVGLEPFTSCFIVKRNQILISLSSLDFEFIMEEQVSEIFGMLHKFKMKVSLIQNSAISFSVCVDDKFGHFEDLKKSLSSKFSFLFNRNVSLYTVRHFTDQTVDSLTNDKVVLLHQITSETLQIIVEESRLQSVELSNGTRHLKLLSSDTM